MLGCTTFEQTIYRTGRNAEKFFFVMFREMVFMMELIIGQSRSDSIFESLGTNKIGCNPKVFEES